MLTEFRTAKCRGCGREIVWGTDADGKAIPLDPAALVYEVSAVDEHTQARVIRSREGRSEATGLLLAHMVGHFATCPQANRFSGRTRLKQEKLPL